MSIRPRSSSASDEASPTHKRVEEYSKVTKRVEPLYFDDGNIVLLADEKDSNTRLAFRIHRGVLSKKSPVFADMFSLPTPENAEKYDGLPCVWLADEADDVTSLLNAVYHAERLPFSTGDRTAILEVGGALVLSKKYMMGCVSSRIVKWLEVDWPKTLVEWDINETRTREIEHGWLHRPFNKAPLVDDMLPDPATVIYLARRSGISHILPPAFYQLSRLPLDADFTSCRKAAEGQKKLLDHHRTARWGVLLGEDFKSLLHGRENLEQWISNRSEIQSPCENLTNLDERKICSKGRMELWIDIRDSCRKSRDPLAVLRHYDFKAGLVPSFDEEICFKCRVSILCLAAKLREEFWCNLPSFFNLDVKCWDTAVDCQGDCGDR